MIALNLHKCRYECERAFRDYVILRAPPDPPIELGASGIMSIVVDGRGTVTCMYVTGVEGRKVSFRERVSRREIYVKVQR